MERSVTDKLRSYDPFVFWISAIITVLFVVWAAVFPDNMNRVINGVFNWTTGYWGWLIFPTLANMLWYTVVGGAGISFDVTETLSTEGLESAIFAIANNLPITGIISIILIILIVTFFLTSANSAALSLSMFTSGSEEPTKRLRIFWGISLGAVAAVLAGTGGLKAIQTASIATAFPLMFLLLLVIYGTFRGLSLYRKENPDLTANKEQA
ncbi:MAG: BCCT family transporter [Spirochaetota bacterium]